MTTPQNHTTWRTTRAERIALIAAAILEAILIFGVLVPTVLSRSHATERPHDAPGATDE